jgi:hypothetical protein
VKPPFSLRLVVLSALLLLLSRPALSDEKPAPPKGQRVFVCGHSFHVMIARPLGEVASKAGIKDHEHAGTQFLGGSRTIQHWNLPDEKNKAKRALKSGKVDVLTLSPHAQLPDEGIDHFTALALEHNGKIRVFVQASWAAFDQLANRRKGFKNADRDDAKIDELRKNYEPFYRSLVKQVSDLNKTHEKKHGRPVVFLAPVGHAVMALREKVVAGKVPGITKQSELFTDPIGHARPPVAILATYVHHAMIYRTSPVGLPVPRLLESKAGAEDAKKLNRLLQEIAWEAVTKEPLSGVKDAAKVGG